MNCMTETSTADDELLERMKLLWPRIARADAVAQTIETVQDDLTNVAVQASYLKLHETSRAALEQCREDDLAFLRAADHELQAIGRKSATLLDLVRTDEERARRNTAEREGDVRQYIGRLFLHEQRVKQQREEACTILEKRRALEREMHIARHKS